MARNPAWSRDELILALELYFRARPSQLSQRDPQIISLSQTLNKLPPRQHAKDAERFRNPNGVYMKLANFFRFDPSYSGKGLKRGGKLEKKIWDEFANDREKLAAVAAAIKATANYSELTSIEQEFDDAMIDAYHRTGKETGYWGNYFLRSVRNHGGIATVKGLLQPSKGNKPSKGLQALIDAGRLDLTLEAFALQERFASLFTKEELVEANRRLAAFPEHMKRKPVASDSVFPEAMSENRIYTEGAVRTVKVNAYERDQAARAACIKHFGIRCRVCDMSFEERYGDIGKGFIHIHHLKPLATMRSTYQLNPSKDLAPVCPNCHAMLHTSDPPLSVEELKQKLSARKEFRQRK